MRLRLALSLLAAALVLTSAASAHVTVNPDSAPAGEFFRFAIRVPNERPRVDTTKLAMELPEGLFFVSFEAKPGWRRTVEMERLAEPVEIFGQEITERVARVTWEGERIRPGEFVEFGLSARLPEAPGEELIFPALQTYSSGEIVRWIGPPDADQPAPRVRLTAPEEGEGDGAAAAEVAPPQAESGDDSRANVALGFGIAGLVAGLLALGVALLRPRLG